MQLVRWIFLLLSPLSPLMFPYLRFNVAFQVLLSMAHPLGCPLRLLLLSLWATKSLWLVSKVLLGMCHDPSHGGFYMAKGTLYIRIGLSPHVVSGDCLVSSRCGLTARYLHCHHAYPMSRDWGCISTSYRSLYVLPFLYAALRAILLPTIRSTDMVLRIPWWTTHHAAITACICWCSMGFHTLPILIATVLGLRYFSHWYDNAAWCGL